MDPFFREEFLHYPVFFLMKSFLTCIVRVVNQGELFNLIENNKSAHKLLWGNPTESYYLKNWKRNEVMLALDINLNVLVRWIEPCGPRLGLFSDFF